MVTVISRQSDLFERLLFGLASCAGSRGDAAIAARYVQIHDFHEARLAHGSDDKASPYRPLAPEKLYLSQAETDQLFEQGRACRLFAFAPIQVSGQVSAKTVQPLAQDAGGRAAIRLVKVEGNSAVPGLAAFVTAERSAAKRPIIVACNSPGAASRLADLLDGRLGAGALQPLTIEHAESGGFYVMQWPLETGFKTDHLVVVSGSDILVSVYHGLNQNAPKVMIFCAKSAFLRRVIWWFIPNMALAAMKGDHH